MSRLCLIIGMKETGKSTTIATMVKRLSRKTLIIDPGEATVYQDFGYQPITLEAIPNFSHTLDADLPGVEKIRRISNVVNKKKLIAGIFGVRENTDKIYKGRAFVNGNLVLEDAAGYINHHMPENLIGCIKGMKQYGLNLILAYHSISEIPEGIMSLQPDLVIFKKTGDLEKIFTKIQKTKHFRQRRDAMKAYYQAMFFGLTPVEIYDNYLEYLPAIKRELRYAPPMQMANKKEVMKFTKWLSTFAHNRVNPSPAQREMLRYQPFSASMRFKV